MKKIFLAFSCFIALFAKFNSATATVRPSNYMSANSYNNLYPYMNNTMKTNLNPGVTPSQNSAQINVLARTSQMPGTTARKVVSRPTARVTNTTNTARAAVPTSNTSNMLSSARAATTTAQQARAGVVGTTSNANSARRVVARSAVGTGTTMAAATSRNQAGITNSVNRAVPTAYYYTNNANNTTTSDKLISSSRCLADYTECMNGYCQRENTSYNRCYCSSKLTQIDSYYKPAIDTLIKDLITAQQKNYWTDEEMNEWWMDTVGKYTGENSWTNLDDALDIDWSGTESQVRGQQTFVTGHEYCVQHLKACAYMASNLRDAYKSEIAKDCSAYESSLQRLKNALESLVNAAKK